jgi:hypothetical protein
VACVHDLHRAAIRCPLERPRFAYLSPFLRQSKTVAWDYLRAMIAPASDAEANADMPIDQKLLVKPVMLSAGRAKLPTKPAPTGSDTVTKTIGTVRLSRRSADTTMGLLATTTPGFNAINSFARA